MLKIEVNVIRFFSEKNRENNLFEYIIIEIDKRIKMSTQHREMKVLITGESENPTKMNLQAGKFKMIIDEPKMMGRTDEEKASWLEETERRCPVTDNIKADTTVNVSIV